VIGEKITAKRISAALLIQSSIVMTNTDRSRSPR
jgi:hypothetical protein